MARHTFATARWFSFRLLGLVYLCAFASLAAQITGLTGTNGILPAGVPDFALVSVSTAGAVVSVALMAGLVPIVVAPILWAAWLFLSRVGSEFLSYQWDALLLEAGLLAIAVAPAVWRDRLREAADPPRVGRWLMWWLLFRLMFGSGGMKLASGDSTWRDLSALMFHYETQPIPNAVAFYFHQLPAALQKASTAVTLAVELFAPFLIVAPRRLRHLGAALLIGLQLLIELTGNFAFFNLLAVTLCLWLLDDDFLRTWGPVLRRAQDRSERSRGTASAGPGKVRPKADPPYTRAVAAATAIITVPVSLLTFTSSLGVLMPGWSLVAPLAQTIAPLRSVNSYGLFAVMTTTRPEIVVEGSNDGNTWMAYEFKYKPGDVMRRPPWVAPHQPRLDWQMWFAALGRYEENVWFQNFCVRLLQASPDVLRLLQSDPFSGHPPRFVRGVLYQYRFADLAAHRAQGIWWTRERLGDYSPSMSLRTNNVP